MTMRNQLTLERRGVQLAPLVLFCFLLLLLFLLQFLEALLFKQCEATSLLLTLHLAQQVITAINRR